MATAVAKSIARPIPRVIRQKVEGLIGESYAFMDSPVFGRKSIEEELFDFEHEPQLPLVSWYQPTRDEAVDQTIAAAPQLMKAGEERVSLFGLCGHGHFDLGAYDAYLAGPTKLVQETAARLASGGMTEDQIHIEDFGWSEP